MTALTATLAHYSLTATAIRQSHSTQHTAQHAALQPHASLTAPVQDAVNLALVQELRVLGLDALELDGDLLARRHVGPEVNVAKRPAANLAAQPVLFPHAQLHDESLKGGLCRRPSTSNAKGESTRPLLLSCCSLLSLYSRLSLSTIVSLSHTLYSRTLLHSQGPSTHRVSRRLVQQWQQTQGSLLLLPLSSL
jgi:hypothetical protein